MTTLYMAVTPDELELPLFVTDYCRELANKYGISNDNLLSQIAHNCSGRDRGAKFIRVIVDDNEE